MVYFRSGSKTCHQYAHNADPGNFVLPTLKVCEFAGAEPALHLWNESSEGWLECSAVLVQYDAHGHSKFFVFCAVKSMMTTL